MRVAAAAALSTFAPGPAAASLARAARVEELMARSQHVLVGEPLDAESVWEQVGDRRHIVTYHRVRTVDVLAGRDPKQEELMVRTLGGRVGKLAELVHGEAVINWGERGVLFVMPTRGVLAVTAMAQGHYPLARDKVGVERLLRNPAATELVREPGSAVARLVGLDVTSARALLRQVRK